MVLGLGIIPAYAGSTDGPPDIAVEEMDHPRIRGEHHPRHVGEGIEGGSSPRMRGARVDEGLQLLRERIIPAYAGSTGNSPLVAARRWDHPRIRGEHVAANG